MPFIWPGCSQPTSIRASREAEAHHRCGGRGSVFVAKAPRATQATDLILKDAAAS